MSILISILIFSLIILVHEFGHFIVAKKSGVFVEEFAMGMGPVIYQRKKGETLFSLRLFPIGGFCRMLGEDEDSNDPRAFVNKKVSRRIAVTVAGALMNFMLAFLAFFLITAVNGLALPEVGSLMEGYPALEAGLQPGDKFVKVNDTRVHIYDDLIFELDAVGGNAAQFTIKRGNETFVTTITPAYYEAEDRYLLGFSPVSKTGWFQGTEAFAAAGFFEALHSGFYQFIFWIKITFVSLARLFTGKLNLNDMAGFIGIVQSIGDTYEQTQAAQQSILVTILTMTKFMGMLSANIGIFNLLPLPALDGGRLVFLLIEAVRRKPIDPNKEGLVHFIGFVLLMILAVVVAFNDIHRFIST